ncbi:hypothetical protein AAG570_003634 [Ranatra chinensis]|uniref:Uncharacterized protein n=1 Tax=Ranatra chinensis TaxID=642074 RepID=A0ABD0Y5E9_9HEMI
MSDPPPPASEEKITKEEYERLVNILLRLGSLVQYHSQIKIAEGEAAKPSKKVEAVDKPKAETKKKRVNKEGKPVKANKLKEKETTKKKENTEKVSVLGVLGEVNEINQQWAIEENPGSYVLFANRAVTFIKLGLYNLALQDSNSALELDPTNLRALMHKATALFFTNKAQKAEEVVNQALKIYPERIKYINGRKDMWKTIELKPNPENIDIQEAESKPPDDKE